MNTGKVEYAPDYKSKTQVRRVAAQTGKKYPDMTDKFKAMEVRAQHQRLQSAVVEAVKEWATDVSADSRGAASLRSAIYALIEFEAQHGIGEK